MCAVLTVGIGDDIIAPQRSDRSPSRIFFACQQSAHHHVPQKNSRNPALCMVITELDIGGAEKAFVRLAHGLAFSGWSVRVICLRGPGPLGQELQDREIPVEYLNCRGFADVRAPFRLATSLRKQRPDIVLSFLHQANVASRIACRLAGVAVQVSGIRVADRRLFVMLTERLTAHWTTHCVAVSEHVATAHLGDAAANFRAEASILFSFMRSSSFEYDRSSTLFSSEEILLGQQFTNQRLVPGRLGRGDALTQVLVVALSPDLLHRGHQFPVRRQFA